MYHGKDIGNRDMNILSRTGFGTNGHGGSVKERPNIVGLLNASFSVPNNVAMVGEEGSTQSGAIDATDTNHLLVRAAVARGMYEFPYVLYLCYLLVQVTSNAPQL
jgi:hypothetical protein